MLKIGASKLSTTRQKPSKPTGVVFVLTGQAVELLQENPRWYDEVVSGELLGGINTYAYVAGSPLNSTDSDGLETVYSTGNVLWVANPGPPALGDPNARSEHGQQGAGHHLHTRIGNQEGPRILTKTFKVYPGDEKLCKGDFKKALDNLTEGEKQYLRRAQMQVFNDQTLGSRLRNVRLRLYATLGRGSARGGD